MVHPPHSYRHMPAPVHLALVCLLLFIGLHVSSSSTVAAEIFWTRQFGSPDVDVATALSLDSSGNSYVTGYTFGSLPGQTSAGAEDVFVRKYTSSGMVAWTRQFGTSANETAYAIAVDGSGNSYITGATGGSLAGTSAGSDDIFVHKYTPDGTVEWTRQFGTGATDFSGGVAVDSSGSCYVVGYTRGTLPGQAASGLEDVFIRKYTSTGTEAWTHQFGTSTGDYADGVAVDSSGNSYVTGYTDGSLPGQASAGSFDVFVRKYTPAGAEEWTRQFGSSGSDFSTSIAVDSQGNSSVAGHTDGTLPGQTQAGNGDAFVRRYTSDGGLLWMRQFGTSNIDSAAAVAIDTAGNSYVAGSTYGDLAATNAGNQDAYVRKYTPDGSEAWTKQFGTTANDVAGAMAVDNSNNCYAAGSTAGTLAGQTPAGNADAYLLRIVGEVSLVPVVHRTVASGW